MSIRLWRRVRQGLAQYARQHHIDPRRASAVAHALHEIKPLCGEATQSRKALYRLGCALLQDRPHILVPVCPDYSHDGRQYTYQGVGEGIPLLAQQHAQFLRQLGSRLGHARVTLLLADQEAHAETVAVAMHISTKEFVARVRASVQATRKFVSHQGWRVALMTEYIPGFLEAMERESVALQSGGISQSLLLDLNEGRTRVYRQIGYPPEVWIERTPKNAAAYIVLARLARERGAIVCNHTTPNLMWYRKEGTALLHHHIRIYH